MNGQAVDGEDDFHVYEHSPLYQIPLDFDADVLLDSVADDVEAAAAKDYRRCLLYQQSVDKREEMKEPEKQWVPGWPKYIWPAKPG